MPETDSQDLLRALLQQDLVRANNCLAAHPELGGRLSVEQVHNRRTIEAAPVWRIELDGTSRFRFHAKSWQSVPELIFSRWITMLPLIAAVIPVAKPGRCYFNIGDEAHRPGLTFCGNRPEHIPIPDPYFMDTRGYQALRDMFSAQDVPWADRAAVLFWRGTTTGPYQAQFDELPRVALSRLARSMGARADVGLSSVAEKYNGMIPSLVAEGIFRDYVPPERFDRYQLHVDIDGHSNSWPGLISKLHSGGTVLKVESQEGFRQWYYDRLEPWVHYVPVRSDLSDLVTQAERLLGEPALAERIGRAGQAFARAMTFDEEIRRITPAVAAAFEPFEWTIGTSEAG